MKKIIVTAVLLSALMLTLPLPHTNNLATKAKVNTKVGQRHNTGLLTTNQAETTSKPVATTTAAVQQPLTSKQSLMQQAGIPQSDWNAVDYIVSHESSWNAEATNASSGAHGLCQALPASKMASAGADYMTNPVTQLRWCHDYALNRYSSWWSAFAFWQANRWW